MAFTNEAVARVLNDSVRAANLSSIANNNEWADLIETFFTSETGDSSCHGGNTSDEDASDSDTASQITDDSDITHSDPLPETDESPVIVNDCETVVRNSSLNLVSVDFVTENELIKTFACKCKFNNGLPCHSQYLQESCRDYRLQIQELDRHEKDLVILAQIASHIQCSENTISSNKKAQKARERIRITYYHEGREICREMFKFLHGISQDKLTGLIKWYREHGLVPKKCRSGGRLEKTALSFEDVTQVVQFVTNYAEANALILPGRVPGYKRSDIKLLPSSDTKASLWRTYQLIMNDEGKRAVKLSCFKSLWQQLLPNMVMTKPMTDLCWRCQDNNTKIFRSANLSEEEKSETLREQEEHLRVVKLERSYYNSLVTDFKDVVTANTLDLGNNGENSRPISAHYSFDFAQQIFYPNDPLQPGPIYFLVPRKCAIFGVCCEGIPKQVNFLIDEGSSVSKGSNSVISYLDYFFTHYGLGEEDVHLHADNCSGQNKNRFMLWYLCWRTLYRRHSTIAIHFLITGHTKFAPDWCFGLLKQKYRKTPVSCLADIESVVRDSTVTGANVPQLVGTEDGTQIVPTRDWQTFLAPHFRPMPGIKSFQHFRFDANTPGVVYYKQYSDCTESQFQLLRNPESIPRPDRSAPIHMRPLDTARASYLFKKIRPFVRENVRDRVCPDPSTGPNRPYNRKRNRDDSD